MLLPTRFQEYPYSPISSPDNQNALGIAKCPRMHRVSHTGLRTTALDLQLRLIWWPRNRLMSKNHEFKGLKVPMRSEFLNYEIIYYTSRKERIIFHMAWHLWSIHLSADWHKWIFYCASFLSFLENMPYWIIVFFSFLSPLWKPEQQI